MQKTILFMASLLAYAVVYAQSTIKLSELTLMHEMRETPSPDNRALITTRSVVFMWPLQTNTRLYNTLDGIKPKDKPQKPDVSLVNYKVRYSTDPLMIKDVTIAATSWPFYYPETLLDAGKWYWQYAYVDEKEEKWSEQISFTIEKGTSYFCPPTYNTIINKLPAGHPKILLFKDEWDGFIKQSLHTDERSWYLQHADKVVKLPIVKLENAIDTNKVAELDNIVKKNALLTRESRRIVDREERNVEALVRAYLLTRNSIYAEAAMRRIEEIVSWKDSPYLVGDFNESTLLSLSSLAYDSFYAILSNKQKRMLLHEIKENGENIFQGFTNRLENHIADNHNWQMNFRIFTMAAFATYGELPEAKRWTEYAYNLWIARFPGLNEDGGWHNGDSYFHVNLRTLIEVPYFYSRISGYDFFSDPWYKGSGMYTIYQQPPFSKSGGNGSSHQNILKPSGTRVGYADALARLTGNSFLADYVRVISAKEPDILKTGFLAKPGDLSWFRLRCRLPLPSGKGLGELPLSYIFPQTGLASFMSDWNDPAHNAMLSFRSSPFGSTSHALANQNAFNTFYGGKPLFYSSGHHISFTDEHSVYCHRATRAHNTILVNGMGQCIGTEGYGWIPRYYSGKKIGYVVGDASNAYGEVVSPLWISRGELSGLHYTPENGWDKNHLKTFRRHIVQLGEADLIFVYDELEADTCVNWNYLLHTIEQPMEITAKGNLTHIRATHGEGASDAYLFTNEKPTIENSDKFFYPAVNWLRANDSGYFAPYKNHFHFMATTPKKTINRFATIISTQQATSMGYKPEQIGDGIIRVNGWIITFNLSHEGKPCFSVKNEDLSVFIEYNDSTQIREDGKVTVLEDQRPTLEI